MDHKQFSALFEELRMLRKEVIELKRLVECKPEQPVSIPRELGLDGKITAVLEDLRVPANVQGYSMAREAIKLVYRDTSLLRAFTTILYPDIAKIYDSAPNRVERAIRHAIEVSWSKNRKHPFYSYRFSSTKPTNSEFVALIVDKLKLEEAYEKPTALPV